MRKEPAFKPPARDETFTPATGPPVPPGGQSDTEPPPSRERSRDRLLDVAPSPPPRGAPLTTTPTPALWTTVEAFSEPIGDDSPCAGWPDYRWPGGVGGGTDPLPLPPGAASLQLSANSSPARNPPQPSPPLQPIKSAPPVSVLTPCSPQNPAPRTATHSVPAAPFRHSSRSLCPAPLLSHSLYRKA